MFFCLPRDVDSLMPLSKIVFGKDTNSSRMFVFIAEVYGFQKDRKCGTTS
jgi:hypothetical protein